MSTKLFDQALFTTLDTAAHASDRRRAHHCVHAELTDPVQRLFITLYPDSYVRPHRHSQAEKWEFFWMVDGGVSFLMFSEKGELLERHELSADGPVRGLEIPPNTWHAVVPASTPATFFEVKSGPYMALADEDFAPWAPAENSADVADFLDKLKSLRVGQHT